MSTMPTKEAAHQGMNKHCCTFQMQVTFVSIQDSTVTIHDCKLFNAVVESLWVIWSERHIQLALISIGMMQKFVFTNPATKWSGIEGKPQWPSADPWGTSNARWSLDYRLLFSFIPKRGEIQQSQWLFHHPSVTVYRYVSLGEQCLLNGIYCMQTDKDWMVWTIFVYGNVLKQLSQVPWKGKGQWTLVTNSLRYPCWVCAFKRYKKHELTWSVREIRRNLQSDMLIIDTISTRMSMTYFTKLVGSDPSHMTYKAQIKQDDTPYPQWLKGATIHKTFLVSGGEHYSEEREERIIATS